MVLGVRCDDDIFKQTPVLSPLIEKSMIIYMLYPELPRRQCSGLVFLKSRVRVPLTTLVICGPHGAPISTVEMTLKGNLPVKGGELRSVNNKS